MLCDFLNGSVLAQYFYQVLLTELGPVGALLAVQAVILLNLLDEILQ